MGTEIRPASSVGGGQKGLFCNILGTLAWVMSRPLRLAGASGAAWSDRPLLDATAVGPAFGAPATRDRREVCRFACRPRRRITVSCGIRGVFGPPFGLEGLGSNSQVLFRLQPRLRPLACRMLLNVSAQVAREH